MTTAYDQAFMTSKLVEDLLRQEVITTDLLVLLQEKAEQKITELQTLNPESRMLAELRDYSAFLTGEMAEAVIAAKDLNGI